MTLKEYIDGLQKFAKENPETLSMQVITSKDDEGNGYYKVCFEPTKGNYDNIDFIPVDGFEEWGKDKSDLNAVCVN